MIQLETNSRNLIIEAMELLAEHKAQLALRSETNTKATSDYFELKEILKHLKRRF